MVVVDAKKDLYKVLGVDKNASDREIKKAFHKQSLKYHPDKNKAKNAQSKFEEISHAYEILSDADKRKQYDLVGDETGHGFGGANFGGQYGGQQFQSDGPFFQSGGPGGRTFTFTFGGPNQGGGDDHGFSQFFGNSQSGRQSRQKQNNKRQAGAQSGWAKNIYDKFAGNGDGDSGFGNFGNFANFGGGMFDNLFSSFTGGGGEPKQGENISRKTVNVPKGVEKIGPKKFKTQVLGTEKVSWVILYYMPDSPGISDKLKALAYFAEEMKGIVKVGAVDCDSQDKFCKEQEIQQFPKLLIYPLRAGGRAKPVPYNGDWTIKAVKKFINQQFSPFTITLTHENFVEVMSKDQERPLAILVRKTKDHPVSWVALCAEFEKRVDCYDTKVTSDEDPLAKKLGVKEFPEVVGLLPNGDRLHPDGRVFDESLPKTVGSLRTFLEKLEKNQDLESNEPNAVPVPHLTKTNMKKVCGPDSSLCIIAASKSSKGEEKSKRILTEISQKSLVRKSHGKGQPVSYSLVDAAKRKTFMKAFSAVDLSSIDTVLVAYKPRRGRSALYRGPLTLEGVEDFVTKALVGDVTFEPVYETPTL